MSSTSTSPINFPLGPAVERTAVQSLRSLIAHLKTTSSNQTHEPIQLILNSQTSLISKKDYIPRIIPVPNRLGRVSETRILLITKDPAGVYKDSLTKAGSPTEDLIKEILPLKKLRKISQSKKSMIQLFQGYDLLLCDVRVQHLLPDILGEMFYAKNKKLPFAVEMFKRTEVEIKAKMKVKGMGKSMGVKKAPVEERCEAEYVLKQIKSIVKNTSYLPNTDSTISVKIGYSDMKTIELMANMAAVIDFLRNEKFQKSNGGVYNKKNQLVSVFVKSAESAALPVYKNPKFKESLE
ncbi:hypothetical protein WICPIJ_002306 [Wickerhamomyces pijperi]|uniref:Ribosomal protein L1 n=1 Tax=Wickerhamomyces pijperi TaxID=599730 RepID=A0A9P8QC28_WICPI|nr:hypothetical protein WICPIJ_002306 [Wickerhamomyces pijperi]